MTTKTPGRPKGTRVMVCACGRRVAGQLGKYVACPDCGKRIKISVRKQQVKAVYLTKDDVHD